MLPASPLIPTGNVTREDPAPGRSSVPFNFDASAAVDLLFDFTNQYANRTFSPPSRMYIDNHANPSALNIACSITGYTASFPPYSMGVIPLFVRQMSTVRITSAGGVIAPATTAPVFVEFLNYDVPCFVAAGFAPFVAGSSVVVEGRDGATPMGDTNPLIADIIATVGPTNLFHAFAGAGVFQIQAAQANARHIRLRNVGDGAGGEPMAWFRLGAAASGTPATDHQLPANGQWEVLPYRTAQLLSVYAEGATNIECEAW